MAFPETPNTSSKAQTFKVIRYKTTEFEIKVVGCKAIGRGRKNPLNEQHKSRPEVC